MAKKKATASAETRRIRRAFNLAIQRRSRKDLTSLMDLCGIPHGPELTRAELVRRLKQHAPDNRRKLALQNTLLAGQTSLSIYQFVELERLDVADNQDLILPGRNFDVATGVPKIAEIGNVGDIVPNLQVIVWAIRIPEEHYIDLELKLKSEGQAAIIHSFYEPQSRTLQVRADARISGKIAVQWAELCGVPFVEHVQKLAITNRDDLHAFADQIDARIVKSTGEKRINTGFLRVSGELHPDGDDLLNTADYNEHVRITDPVDAVIEVRVGVARYRIGVGMKSESLVFRSKAPESLIQDIYEQLYAFYYRDDQE
ncbi:MAG: hypothetical protein AAGI37_12610 [Planctomycetota bacterium]